MDKLLSSFVIFLQLFFCFLHFQSKENLGIHSLEIKRSVLGDSGIYACKLENELGKEERVFSLVVSSKYVTTQQWHSVELWSVYQSKVSAPRIKKKKKLTLLNTVTLTWSEYESNAFFNTSTCSRGALKCTSGSWITQRGSQKVSVSTS